MSTVIAVICALVCAALSLVVLRAPFTVARAETMQTEEKEYEIYPLPHSVVYGEGETVIPKTVL